MKRQNVKKSFLTACEKELSYIEKREASFRTRAAKDEARWISYLNDKIPRTANRALRSAFLKVFTLIFEKGDAVIGKTYNAESLSQSYTIRNCAVDIRSNRRELKRLRTKIKEKSAINTAAASIEGIGLGVLGIGIPDIALFLGILLRGINESAVGYGFDCTTQQERFFMLKMIEASISKGDDHIRADEMVDALLRGETMRPPTPSELEEQISRTADALAADMLLCKFVQGIPVVGIVGGVINPVYCHRVTSYVQLKYYKRYIYGKIRSTDEKTIKISN